MGAFIIITFLIGMVIFGIARKHLRDILWDYVTKYGEYKYPQDHLQIKNRWLNVVIVMVFTFIGLMVLLVWLT